MVEITKRLEFEELPPYHIGDMEIKRLGAVLDKALDQAVIGVDPGYKFGLTFLSKNGYAYLYHGEMTDKIRNHPAVVAYQCITDLCMVMTKPDVAYVEGASYGAKFGQVKLESIRSGMVMALHFMGVEVRIVPPATWRKRVLGSAKARAEEVWPIKDHAADSLAIAMYGAGLTYNHLVQSVSDPLPNK